MTETPALAAFEPASLHAEPLSLPELHCPFAPAVNPEAEALQARSIAWACTMGLCPTEGAAARLDKAKIAWLVARAHPHAARPVLQIAADWTVLFCMLDDHLERLPSPSAVAAVLADLGQILCDGRALHDLAARPFDLATQAFFRAGADLYTRLAGLAAPPFRARVASRMRVLFEAFVREAHGRQAGRPPGLERYLPMREVTVGIHVELAFGEIVEGIALSAPARACVKQHGLDRRASNLIAWANDIYTVEKELAQGDPHNLVLVLAAEGRSLTFAAALAARMHDEEARTFAALIASIERSADPELRRYLAMLTRWVRGHLDWGRETGRYRASRS
ncbi:MAG: hypothetical protein U0359_19100 [Byssovorax sp.]